MVLQRVTMKDTGLEKQPWNRARRRRGGGGGGPGAGVVADRGLGDRLEELVAQLALQLQCSRDSFRDWKQLNSTESPTAARGRLLSRPSSCDALGLRTVASWAGETPGRPSSCSTLEAFSEIGSSPTAQRARQPRGAGGPAGPPAAGRGNPGTAGTTAAMAPRAASSRWPYTLACLRNSQAVKTECHGIVRHGVFTTAAMAPRCIFWLVCGTHRQRKQRRPPVRHGIFFTTAAMAPRAASSRRPPISAARGDYCDSVGRSASSIAAAADQCAHCGTAPDEPGPPKGGGA